VAGTTCSRHGEFEQLGEPIAEQAAHLDAAMHRLLADLREFDQRGGWHVQGAISCAHWLAWRVGWDLVARTFEYKTSPRRSASSIVGNSASLQATRTRPGAVL